MLKYEISINWSETDQAFLAEVPELPGLHGRTAPRRRRPGRMFDEVAREWLETARELGRPIPEPRGRPGEAYLMTNSSDALEQMRRQLRTQMPALARAYRVKALGLFGSTCAMSRRARVTWSAGGV